MPNTLCDTTHSVRAKTRKTRLRQDEPKRARQCAHTRTSERISTKEARRKAATAWSDLLKIIQFRCGPRCENNWGLERRCSEEKPKELQWPQKNAAPYCARFIYSSFISPPGLFDSFRRDQTCCRAAARTFQANYFADSCALFFFVRARTRV